MSDIHISKLNESTMHLACDENIAVELREHFTFEVPGFRFMPSYKNKHWDGKVRLFSLGESTLLLGLLSYVLEFAKTSDYTVSLAKDCYPTPIDLNALDQFLDDLKPLDEKGQPISFRDYQRDAIHEVLKWQRRTIVSPTSSGKSLMLYGLCRWLLRNNDFGKILIVVPTKSLVHQMIGDFDNYSAKDEVFFAGDEMHGIMGGKEKDDGTARIYVSTWQSIYKMPVSYFEQFGAVFGDECHQFKSDEIKKVAEKAINATYRAGFTGTLLAKEGAKCHKLVIEGVFGRACKPRTGDGKEVSTKVLMDRKEVAQLSIEVVNLLYSQDISDRIGDKKGYDLEIKEITTNDRRAILICREAAAEKGNVLVLFHHKVHGDLLKHWMTEVEKKFGGTKQIYLISGDNEVEEREELRRILEANNDCVAFASYGVFSTGVSVKNIMHIYFAHPSKSIIRVLQSIGRGLRVNAVKTHVNLKDFVDTFARPRPNGKHRAANFLMKHAADRVKIYSKEGFTFKMRTVDLAA